MRPAAGLFFRAGAATAIVATLSAIVIPGLLLAVETSGPQSGLALAESGRLLAARELSAERAYSSELFPAIRAMLADAGRPLREVALFCFSAGPGSFTGLRIAATVGRMLQSVSSCRVAAVPTLEVIACNALEGALPDGARVVALLDAKGGQAYAAAFERGAEGGLLCIAPAALRVVAEWVTELGGPLVFVGPGVARQRDVCAAAGVILPEELWRPRAATVAVLGGRRAARGELCRPEEIVPHYLRPPECEEVYETRRAAARARRGAGSSGG